MARIEESAATHAYATGGGPSARTRNYLVQLGGSFTFKAFSLLASFAAVPPTIHYLGLEAYGVWSTILSFTTWIALSDLGVGYGLRNKLAEALARNDTQAAARSVSSSYVFLALLTLGLFALFVPLSALVSWQRVFNTTTVRENTLLVLVWVTALSVLAGMCSGLVNQVLNALQRASAVVFGQFLFNALILLSVVALLRLTPSSLVWMASVYGLALIASHAVLSAWCYAKYPFLLPHPAIDCARLGAILRLGVRFLVLELGYVLIVATDKVLITQLFNPQHVGQYDVVFKLFSIVTVGHTLITMPLWSSYTDAYHRGDHDWILRTLRRQQMLFAAILAGIVLLAGLARPIIRLWLGSAVPVSWELVAGIAFFMAVFTWNDTCATVLNGIGATRLQVRLSLVAMLVNIPLAILAIRWWNFGVEAVPIATGVSMLPFAVAAPGHLRTLLRKHRPESA